MGTGGTKEFSRGVFFRNFRVYHFKHSSQNGLSMFILFYQERAGLTTGKCSAAKRLFSSNMKCCLVNVFHGYKMPIGWILYMGYQGGIDE